MAICHIFTRVSPSPLFCTEEKVGPKNGVIYSPVRGGIRERMQIPRKKVPTKANGFLMANWTQIKQTKKQSQQTFLHREPLSQTALQGEACTDLPARTVSLPSGPGLTVDSWDPVSSNSTEALPTQLDLHSSDQSERIYTDQSGQCVLDQSNYKDVAFSFA